MLTHQSYSRRQSPDFVLACRCLSDTYMPTLKQDIETILNIGDKYVTTEVKLELRHWLASCFTHKQININRQTHYKHLVITFIALKGRDFINVSVFDTNNNQYFDDRSILLKPYILKNFGVESLDKLHQSIRCTVYDVWQMVEEVEGEILDCLGC